MIRIQIICCLLIAGRVVQAHVAAHSPDGLQDCKEVSLLVIVISRADVDGFDVASRRFPGEFLIDDA